MCGAAEPATAAVNIAAHAVAAASLSDVPKDAVDVMCACVAAGEPCLEGPPMYTVDRIGLQGLGLAAVSHMWWSPPDAPESAAALLGDDGSYVPCVAFAMTVCGPAIVFLAGGYPLEPPVSLSTITLSDCAARIDAAAAGRPPSSLGCDCDAWCGARMVDRVSGALTRIVLAALRHLAAEVRAVGVALGVLLGVALGARSCPCAIEARARWRLAVVVACHEALLSPRREQALWALCIVEATTATGTTVLTGDGGRRVGLLADPNVLPLVAWACDPTAVATGIMDCLLVEGAGEGPVHTSQPF